MAALSAGQLWSDEPQRDSRLRDAVGQLESFLTLQDDFQDVSRGKPKPHLIWGNSGGCLSQRGGYHGGQSDPVNGNPDTEDKTEFSLHVRQTLARALF